ncbi:MAG: sulfatase [Bacteroidales bacterium]
MKTEFLLSISLLSINAFTKTIQAATPVRPNVLFIVVDDLRPELGCYGVSHVKTPNIDRLAKSGVVFTRAYCQQALSGATRASLLTGLRPNSTGVFDNATDYRTKNPDVETLPQHFKNNGYKTMTIGKVFHGGFKDKNAWTEELKAKTLDEPYPIKALGGYQLPENREAYQKLAESLKAGGLAGEDARALLSGPATECADVPDQAYTDGISADAAIRAIRQSDSNPFFLAVGFSKPHLSFIAPKKYWDLYDPSKLELTKFSFAPKDCPPMALNPSIELRARTDMPKDGPISDKDAIRLLHGYYACVSYIDAQVGRLLDELDKKGLTQNTIIILWGDHGWNLRDHGLWGKTTDFESCAKAPLIIAAPHKEGNGKSANGLVEFVDVYPTLCELASLSLPSHLEGTSAVTLLNDPSKTWKKAAFTQTTCPAVREWAGKPLDPKTRESFASLMDRVERNIQEFDTDDFSVEKYNEYVFGYSMRTDRYRFTYWMDKRHPEKPLALELYDHEKDPNENVNIAMQPSEAKLVKQLTKQWKEGWQKAKPQTK